MASRCDSGWLRRSHLGVFGSPPSRQADAGGKPQEAGVQKLMVFDGPVKFRRGLSEIPDVLVLTRYF